MTIKKFHLSSEMDAAILPNTKLQEVAKVRKLFGEHIFPSFGIANERLSALVEQSGDNVCVNFLLDNDKLFGDRVADRWTYIEDALYTAIYRVTACLQQAFTRDSGPTTYWLMHAVDWRRKDNNTLTVVFDPITESMSASVQGVRHTMLDNAVAQLMKNKQSMFKSGGFVATFTPHSADYIGCWVEASLADLDNKGRILKSRTFSLPVECLEYISPRSFVEKDINFEFVPYGSYVSRMTVEEINALVDTPPRKVKSVTFETANEWTVAGGNTYHDVNGGIRFDHVNQVNNMQHAIDALQRAYTANGNNNRNVVYHNNLGRRN